jgi:hypothetical protein
MQFPLPDAANESSDASRIARGNFRRIHAVRRWAFLSIAFIISALISRSAEPQFSENQVKGAFLTKFAIFVEWPGKPSPAGQVPVVIGILGDDPFGPQFEVALAKETVNGRPFALRRIKNPQEAVGCQILFISASEEPRLPDILAATRKQPILTVGDHERFAHRGGMINFVRQEGKVRFEVNTAAVEAGGLKMSAKLLQVAIPVTPEAPKAEP